MTRIVIPHPSSQTNPSVSPAIYLCAPNFSLADLEPRAFAIHATASPMKRIPSGLNVHPTILLMQYITPRSPAS